MVEKEDVQKFLEQFHARMSVFGLEELEIVPSYRRIIIESLIADDYVEGPVIDTLSKLGVMWVFGKDVKGREVYIKIMISELVPQTICISFHLAEHPLQYPFK